MAGAGLRAPWPAPVRFAVRQVPARHLRQPPPSASNPSSGRAGLVQEATGRWARTGGDGVLGSYTRRRGAGLVHEATGAGKLPECLFGHRPKATRTSSVVVPVTRDTAVD